MEDIAAYSKTFPTNLMLGKNVEGDRHDDSINLNPKSIIQWMKIF